MKVQMVWGVDFISGFVKDRVKVIVLFFVFFFVSVFKCVEEFVVVMEVRGY